MDSVRSRRRWADPSLALAVLAVAFTCMSGLAAGGIRHPDAFLLGFVLIVTVAVSAGFAAREWLATRRAVDGMLQDERPHPSLLLAGLVRDLGLDGRVQEVESADRLAFCYGVVRPRICVSSALVAMLTRAELEAVLRHEACHLRRRDPLRYLLTGAASRGFFYVPAFREWARRQRIACELIADEAVIREMGDRQPLASALYRAISGPVATQPRWQPGAGAFTSVDARIDRLLGDDTLPEPLWNRRAVLAVLVVAMLLPLWAIPCVSM